MYPTNIKECEVYLGICTHALKYGNLATEFLNGDTNAFK